MLNRKRPTGAFVARCFVAIFALSLTITGQSRCEDAVDRLKLDRLEAIHQSIERLKAERKSSEVDRPFRDFRANLHVHSAFSHDSRGKIEDIVAAAKRAGTSVLMFNEHPAPHYNFLTDGHQGIRDEVLLVPGAEMKGFLVFPKQDVAPFAEAEKQEFSDIVRGRKGLTFVSHLEERMDWKIQGVTGCEIYNTHADFKEEKRLVSSLKNPLWLIQAKKMFDLYPQEALSALLDYPQDYLRRWDELCMIHPHTGVSANDAHQNVGLILKIAEGNKVRVEDPLEEKLLELDRAIVNAIFPIPENAEIGKELFRLQLDPYERSLRHVGTHLLMRSLREEEVWESLNAGRAYVAFDWMADATGFDYALHTNDQRFEMGSQTTWAKGMTLRGTSPHDVRWRLMRNGQVFKEMMGKQFALEIDQSGNYRVEAWLRLGEYEQIWILSNPIYLSAP